MYHGNESIRGVDEPVREGGASPAPGNGRWRPQRDQGSALTVVASETFSMEWVERFFDGVAAPQGNALVSEMVDENGPLAGRESARGRRKAGSLPHQFGDDDRPLLFAPNDAPDQLPREPIELDRLLRQQEFRERRRFGA